jgi:aminopeptidase N
MSGGRYCTQCEAEGFRKITYFLDRPDNLARYSVRIEADADAFPTLLANGNPVDAGPAEPGRRFARWDDPHPKPSYLFALVAGEFDTVEDAFTTRSGRPVRLGVHVDPGDGPRAHYAMDALKRAMRWDEEAFGREYDLDVFNIVAVRDFNFGAMENKGLNVFNSAYVLADPETATDADYEAIESIVGHEYFHNWTGNRITCRDWFQLSLKEGLTVFREQEFSAAQRSRAVQRIKDVKRLRARQFPEDAGPLAHPVRPSQYQKIDNFYTATVYEKGAEVIRMLKRIVGADAFARGMELYFQRCDGTAATVEDFVGCFEEASGQSLDAFMRWYAQAGTPRVRAALRYDASARTADLDLAQDLPSTPGQSAKAAMPIPLSASFLSADGAILAARREGENAARERHALVLTEARQTFRFEGVVRAPIPTLLAEFSAPVILEDGLAPAERFAQMAHDPDPFSRWEAGQALARAAMLAPESGIDPSALAEALGRELDRADKDAAFAALTLRLPDLPELLQISAAPDPDALHAAREALRTAIAERLHDRLVAIAEAPEAATFSPDAAAAGRRALKSAALDLLAARGPSATRVIMSAFAAARSMTQTMAALEALGANGGPEFDQALDAFYRRWRDNPLVMDKWFSVQAGAPRTDSLARAKALSAHALFDLATPNRVRALAMAFALRNPRAFHDASGAGYRFLADIAGSCDRANPALAARLLGPFETWRRFDAGRQDHARAALDALAARADLSRNAREIVERTLA